MGGGGGGGELYGSCTLYLFSNNFEEEVEVRPQGGGNFPLLSDQLRDY